jgi:hypothetical protein
MAPTLVYDALQLGDSTIPTDLLNRVTPQTLAIHSTTSPAWMQSATREAAAALPNAQVVGLEGQFHQVSEEALVPALTKFFLS